jgi:hypothetical protein
MLLGARRDAHICCPALADQLIFFADVGRLWCRSACAIEVNGSEVSGVVGLADGDLISVGEFRVRIEELAGGEVGR